MIVEIVGVPGAGKSSLSARIELAIRARGGTVAGLRDMSLQRVEAARRSVRFLRNRPERTSLYGAYGFRAENQEVFEFLQDGTPEQLPGVLWNLEMMSQYHFVTKGGAGPELVMVDEGFVHRGVAHLIDREGDAFERYNAALPAGFVLMHLDMPVSVAMERAGARYHGLARHWPGADAADITRQMERLHDMTKAACGIRAARGLPVLTVDGTQTLDAVTKAAIAALDAVGPGKVGAQE